MTKTKLIEHLNRLHVPPSIYSVDGVIGPERTVLLHSAGIWEIVGVDLRGNRYPKKSFGTEGEALAYLFDRFNKVYDRSAIPATSHYCSEPGPLLRKKKRTN